MGDLNFEEICPCGNSMKVSGYTSETRLQIQTWQNIHNKHANAIAKAIAEAKGKQHTIWPSRPYWPLYSSTFETKSEGS